MNITIVETVYVHYHFPSTIFMHLIVNSSTYAKCVTGHRRVRPPCQHRPAVTAPKIGQGQVGNIT